MTEVTDYNGSGGPVPILTMNYPHLKAAHAKLVRDGFPASRQDEVDAMAARLAELDALPTDADRINATKIERGDEGAGKVPAPAAAGHNLPPTPDSFDAIRVHIEDLYSEAKNWLDGEPIATQAQADEVSRLLGMIKEAERIADDTRKRENEPFDAGKAAVQAKYAPLISDTKSVRGKTVLAREACQRALTPWLVAQEQERQRAAQAARDEADRLAAEARAAAQSADLSVVEKAEDIFADAKATEREASALERDRAAAGGGEYRRTILRDHFVPILEDGQLALRHLWSTRRADLEAFALKCAEEAVRAGVRTIPGFRVENQQRAA
jgi:hypothetical protein